MATTTNKHQELKFSRRLNEDWPLKNKKRRWEQMMKKMEKKALKDGRVFDPAHKTFEAFHNASIKGGKEGLENMAKIVRQQRADKASKKASRRREDEGEA